MKEEEEEARRAQQEEKEKRKSSMLTKIGNFFSGKGNEQKEESPVKEVVDPVEQERLKRMEIHERIQLELNKIRELDEKRKEQIERERKKQELKRMIQMELNKIQGLDSNKKSEEEDSMPLWMRMVYDPEARKAYVESKNKPAAEKLNVQSQEVRQSRTESVESENIPKWIQIVRERQEALQKAKEQMDIAFSENKNERKDEEIKKMRESLLDLSKVCKETSSASQVENSNEENSVKDSRPPMTFEESVQAMINLLEEDKKWTKDNNKKEKSKLMAKKKDNVILPNVSAVRNQFENLETSPGQPISPVSPCEINQEKVKLAKMQLMQHQQENNSSDGKSKIDVMLTKKCSTIKTMFERSNSTNEKEEQVKPKPKKSIVQVLETPSIDEQLAAKKRQLAAENKWSYKEKSLRDLQHIFSSSTTTAQLAQKAESVLETSKRVAEEQAKRDADKQQELDEYNALMDQIHQFVSDSDKTGKTDEEIAFQNSLTGYLQLIEEDQEYRRNQESAKAQLKKVKKDIKKIPKKISTELFKQDDSNETNTKIKTVKKLDLSKFTSSEKPQEMAIVRKEVNSYNCEMIKDQLEKRTATQTEVSNPIHRKMKLINIETSPSVSQSLAELKAKREQEWKWKQKTIGELQDFLQKNKDLTKNMVDNAKADEEERIGRKKALESMLAKRQQLQRATHQRDEEFEKFMSELEKFSQEPSTDKSDEIFKSSVKSYLELIESQTKTEEEDFALPEITLPSRLDDLKNRITEKEYEPQKPKKPITIKKIQSFFGKNEAQTSSNQDKDLAQTLGPGKASKLKKMFEEKPKISSMMRTRSELTLQQKPVKKTKHLIDPVEAISPLQIPPMLSRRNSVKTSWSNRVSSYFSSPAETKIPEYKKLEQRLDVEVAKSKWDDIVDPEERKRAILAKHGFKPHNVKRMSTNIDDVDTIPEHILKDEVLYRYRCTYIYCIVKISEFTNLTNTKLPFL